MTTAQHPLDDRRAPRPKRLLEEYRLREFDDGSVMISHLVEATPGTSEKTYFKAITLAPAEVTRFVLLHRWCALRACWLNLLNASRDIVAARGPKRDHDGASV